MGKTKKTCPFCGCDSASLINEYNVYPRKGIFAARHCYYECDNCGAHGPGFMCSSANYHRYEDLPDKALAGWDNRRHASWADSDTILMPKSLTAENGAKAAMMGEFFVETDETCDECYGDGCGACYGLGCHEKEIAIPWTTIKDIYKKAVELFGKK